MSARGIELREHPIRLDSQKLIAGVCFESDHCGDDLRCYFRYYSKQCRQVSSIVSIPVNTHTELLRVARSICARCTHEDIRKELELRYPCETGIQLNNTLDLAVRLLLMLDVGIFDNAYTGRDDITWTGGTIDDFMNTIPVFEGRPQLPFHDVKLDTQFNARSLERIAGFEVQLTTNLADHLLLREEMKVVTIFHHAAFLEYHLRRRTNPIFPKDFVEETLQTLALLFPKGNREVERWFKRKGHSGDLDFRALQCGPASRHIERFHFWRDRLVQLKEAFDDTRPRTLAQWWHDRRDGIQWYTLWVAILFSGFFGLIQSIEGGIQVYKAFYPTAN